MSAKKKSWREKLADDKGLPKTGRIEGKMSTRWGTGTMVIPAPREVDELMRRVPKGKLVTINELRAALARKHGVTMACPITTGIFSWIAAHAADEAAREGGQAHHTLLAHAEDGRRVEPEVSGRDFGAEETVACGRARLHPERKTNARGRV